MHYQKTWHRCVAMKTSQLQTSFSVMMPIKQSKQQERLSKSRTATQATSGPTPTNTDTTGLFFFRTDPPPPPPKYSHWGSESSLLGRGKPWNQRGEGKFRGEKSLTARNQNAQPKEVRDFCNSVPSVLEELQKQSEDFSAGQICFCLAQWKQITIDEEILKMVEGVDKNVAVLPVQEKPAHNHKCSTEQIHAIDLEVSELLKKGVIRKAHHSNKEYISPIFV